MRRLWVCLVSLASLGFAAACAPQAPAPAPLPDVTDVAWTTAPWSGSIVFQVVNTAPNDSLGYSSKIQVVEPNAVKTGSNDSWAMEYDYIGAAFGSRDDGSCSPGPGAISTRDENTTGHVGVYPSAPHGGVSVTYIPNAATPGSGTWRVSVTPFSWSFDYTWICNSTTQIRQGSASIGMGFQSYVDIPGEANQRVLSYDSGPQNCSGCTYSTSFTLERTNPLDANGSYSYSVAGLAGVGISAVGTDTVQITGPRLDLVKKVCAESQWWVEYAPRDTSGVSWAFDDGELMPSRTIIAGPTGPYMDFSTPGIESLTWRACAPLPASGILTAADFGFPTRVRLGWGALDQNALDDLYHSMRFTPYGVTPTGGEYAFYPPHQEVPGAGVALKAYTGTYVSELREQINRKF